jgi:DNA polymerase III alpha subunit
LIDLHLHTTASDGRLAPGALITLAAAAGLSTISVTDHDTTAGLAEARAAAEAAGIRPVSGSEITAVEEGRDVHVRERPTFTRIPRSISPALDLSPFRPGISPRSKPAQRATGARRPEQVRRGYS